MKLEQATKEQVMAIVKKWNDRHSGNTSFSLKPDQQDNKYVVSINPIAAITHFTDFYIPLLEDSKNVYSNISLWFEDDVSPEEPLTTTTS